MQSQVVVEGHEFFSVTAAVDFGCSFDHTFLVLGAGQSPVGVWHLDSIRKMYSVYLQASSGVRARREVRLRVYVQDLLLESLKLLEVAPLLNIIRD